MTWPKLDPNAFHGPAGDIVSTIAPETEADPAAILATFLTCYGNAVGRGPHARVGGAQHPARLNTVIVGDSARARKGTSWSDTRRILQFADVGWADRILSGFGSGESLIEAVRDPEGDDAGGGDHRALVREGEFVRILRAAGREGGTLGAIIRDAWDGEPLQSRTVTRGIRKATGAHVSVLAHVTAEELEREMGAVDVVNGFANRFLWVCARRAQKLPNGGNLDDQAMHHLATTVADRLEAARRIGTMHRSTAAEDRWESWYHGLPDEARGAYGAITARADAQALRLSVVYALLDGSRVIEIEHLDAALAFWSYCDDSARHLFGFVSGDPLADRILAAARAAAPAGLDSTQVHQLLGRNVEAKRIAAAREHLEELGLVEVVHESSGRGRPRVIVFANEPISSSTSFSSYPPGTGSGEGKNERNEESLCVREGHPYEEYEVDEETLIDLDNPTEPDWFTAEAAELAALTTREPEPDLVP